MDYGQDVFGIKMYAAMMHADFIHCDNEKNLEEARSYGLTVFESIDEAYNAAIKKEGESAKSGVCPIWPIHYS